MEGGQYAITHANAQDDDCVVELQVVKNWDTLDVIKFYLINDPSGIFYVDDDTLKIADKTDLAVTTYDVVIAASDYVYFDVDTVHITCIAGSSTTHYIDLDAVSDGDGTYATPWNTSEYVDDDGTTGDWYLLKRGTSQTITDQLDILIDNQLNVGAYGAGDRPLVYGNGCKVFYVYQAEDLTIRDLNLQVYEGDMGIIYNQYSDNNKYDNLVLEGIFDHESHNIFRGSNTDSIILQNSFLRHSEYDAIYIELSGRVYILSNFIGDGIGHSAVPEGDGMQINESDTRYTNYKIRHNRIYKNEYNNKHGIEVGQTPYHPCVNVDISYNWLYGYFADLKGISIQPATNAIISYNTIYNCVNGIDLYADGGTGEFVNIDIFGNIINHIRYWGIIKKSGSLFTNINIYNNTLYDCGIDDFPDEHSQAGINFDEIITIKNNIIDANGNSAPAFFDVDEGSDEDYNLAVDGWGDWTEGTHSIEGDACFVNEAIGDFRLKPNSPTIDAGVDVGITEDIEAKEYFRGWWMGAYEYNEDEYLQRQGKGKRNQVIIY